MKIWIVRNWLCLITVTASLFLVSCGKDEFSEVGASLVNKNNFDAALYETSNLTAKTVKFNRVQTNRLPVYQLGVYHDPVFGKSTANLLVQLSLSNPDPDFNPTVELDSVIMTIPYYSHISNRTFQNVEYELDSVYGSGRIDFSIFRSGYYLRDFNPDDEYATQAYYSDQTQLFEQNLYSQPIVEVNNYRPVNEPIYVVESGDTVKKKPLMKLSLPTNYFKDLIIDNSGTGNLISNANFQDFFRGLYFKVESEMNNGVLTYLNIASEDAKITLYYTYELGLEEGQVSTINSTYVLNFGSVVVNTFETQYNTAPDQENLYLKGQGGSIAKINLFPDRQELDSIRNLGWLINEANLKFYVNENAMPSGYNYPQRVFIYNVEENKVLPDYARSTDVLERDLLNSRTTHLGRLSVDKNGNKYYKIRITDYMNQLLVNDSTSTKLALAVSQNVNIPLLVKAEPEDASEEVDKTPATSVISPKGVILHDEDAPIEAKKLELEIYYTETE